MKDQQSPSLIHKSQISVHHNNYKTRTSKWSCQHDYIKYELKKHSCKLTYLKQKTNNVDHVNQIIIVA